MLPPLQVIRGEDTLVESRDVNTGFMQTGFQFLKIGLKPVFGFPGLHRNLNFKPSEML